MLLAKSMRCLEVANVVARLGEIEARSRPPPVPPPAEEGFSLPRALLWRGRARKSETQAAPAKKVWRLGRDLNEVSSGWCE